MTDKREPKPCPFCGTSLVMTGSPADREWQHLAEEGEGCILHAEAVSHLQDADDVACWNTRPASGDAVEALEMCRELIQEAKGHEGPNGGFVTNHLDAAENWLDKIEATLTIQAPAQTEAMALLPEAEAKAKAAYQDEVNNGPIHCNRCASWEELSDKQRRERTLAALRQPASVEAEPVAWRYDWPDQEMRHVLSAERWDEGSRKGWTETPLYAHPPADAEPVAWRNMSTAPVGRVTENVGCRGPSDWFFAQPDRAKYPRTMPDVMIVRRRAWPQEDGWEDPSRTTFGADYFKGWMPIETLTRIDAHLADQVQS